MINILLALLRSTGSANMEIRVKNWLNRTYLAWASELREQTLTSIWNFSNTDGGLLGTQAGPPVDFLSAVNLRILQRSLPAPADDSFRKTLLELTPAEFDRSFPNPNALPKATPDVFTVQTGGRLKLSLPVTKVKSGSAADTTQKVSLVGFAGSDRVELQHVQVTLNGTAFVSLGGSFQDFISVSKDKDTAGIINLTDAAGAFVINIMPWERAAVRSYITFQPQPKAGEIFDWELRYNRQPPFMLNDADVPFMIPHQYHHAIVEGAAVLGMGFIDDTRVQVAAAFHDKAKTEFLGNLRSQEIDDGRIRWRRTRRRELHVPDGLN